MLGSIFETRAMYEVKTLQIVFSLDGSRLLVLISKRRDLQCKKSQDKKEIDYEEVKSKLLALPSRQVRW